jgi:hypothetical protein
MSQNYYEPLEEYDTHAVFYTEHCKIKQVIRDEKVIFYLKIGKELCNTLGYIDYGVLLTFIEGLCSYSKLFLSKNQKRTLSVNLNVKTFKKLEINKTYEMTVKIFSEDSMYTCYKCKIKDEKGGLMCLATHLRRNLSPKF